MGPIQTKLMRDVRPDLDARPVSTFCVFTRRIDRYPNRVAKLGVDKILCMNMHSLNAAGTSSQGDMET